MGTSQQSGHCELCGRDGVITTVHHLTPKEMGGTFEPTADLCIPCHKQIHALYTNEELADGLNTVNALRQDDRLSGYVKWIRKQPAESLPSVRKSHHVKGRR